MPDVCPIFFSFIYQGNNRKSRCAASSTPTSSQPGHCKAPSHQGVSLQPGPSRRAIYILLELICNAAVMDDPYMQESRRMFEIQFGVNHLVPTFYTHKSILLDHLKESQATQIVKVTSNSALEQALMALYSQKMTSTCSACLKCVS